MKKYYFLVLATLSVIFIFWLLLRGSILLQDHLFPADKMMLFVRDGSSFFIFLRSSFVLLWGLSIFFAFKNQQWSITWWAVLFYLFFLAIDHGILIYLGYYYQVPFSPEDGNYPFVIYKGLLEGIFLMLINYLIGNVFLRSMVSHFHVPSAN